jgi:hypothetical protein
MSQDAERVNGESKDVVVIKGSRPEMTTSESDVESRLRADTMGDYLWLSDMGTTIWGSYKRRKSMFREIKEFRWNYEPFDQRLQEKLRSTFEALNLLVLEYTPAERFRVPTDVWAIRPARLSGLVAFIPKLMDFWQLTEEQTARMLGFESHELQQFRDLISGVQKLEGRDAKDRIGHLLAIRETLHGLFRNAEVERDWLNDRKKSLDEKSPLELLVEGSMENMLLVKQYVLEQAGH